MLSVGWTVLREERGGASTLFFYLLIHLAGLFDRFGLRRFSNWVRRLVSIQRVELQLSRFLRTDFRFVTTEAGGCAIDIDKESEYDALQARYEEWRAAQDRRAEELYGPLSLPDKASRDEGDGP